MCTHTSLYRQLIPALAISLLGVTVTAVVAADDPFVDSVAPVLARRCLSCHNDNKTGGNLSLVDPRRLIDDGYVSVSDATQSHLVDLITPQDGRAEMPKDADPLNPQELAAISRWIDAGAAIPESYRIEPPEIADLNWWSLRPIEIPAQALDSRWVDERIDAKLRDNGLSPLPAADPVDIDPQNHL